MESESSQVALLPKCEPDLHEQTLTSERRSSRYCFNHCANISSMMSFRAAFARDLLLLSSPKKPASQSELWQTTLRIGFNVEEAQQVTKLNRPEWQRIHQKKHYFFAQRVFEYIRQ